MPLRFRVLPTDDTRPAGNVGAGAAGPLVEREVALSEALAEIRVGRRPDVELPLPFAVLSGVHARLSRASGAGGWVVEDLGSTNGTWLDGASLRPGERRPIAPGAELRLATVRLRFEGATAAAPAAEGTATIARRLVDDLFGAAGDGAPTIRVERGPPSVALRLAIVGRSYVVGRADTCALALPVEEISREHAAFVRGAEGVCVRDLGSKNGVVVAGARVVGERALADGDAVTVGPVTLTLDDPTSRYLRELERLAADVAPAPPPPTPAAPFEAARAPVTPAEPSTVGAKLGASRLSIVVAAVAVAALVLLALAAAAMFF